MDEGPRELLLRDKESLIRAVKKLDKRPVASEWFAKSLEWALRALVVE